MSVASASAGGEFRIGQVLNRAFEVCGANFVLFFAVTFVVSLPNLIFTLQPPSPEPSFATGAYFLIAIILGLFLNTIGEAVILFGAFQYLRGQPVAFGQALKKGLARFFPIIGFAIVYSIALFFGFMFLIVPGVILFIMWT